MGFGAPTEEIARTQAKIAVQWCGTGALERPPCFFEVFFDFSLTSSLTSLGLVCTPSECIFGCYAANS